MPEAAGGLPGVLDLFPAAAATVVYTVGHSNRTAEEFVALLRQVGTSMLVDVRAFPSSRANPQFNGDVLADSLSGAGLSYRHLPALGGRRHRARGDAASPNGFWQHPAFRNYADYAMTPAFREGLEELVGLARTQTCTIMCAEAVWWRCHRRIIADYLLVAGIPVAHIMVPNKVAGAELTVGARPGAEGTIRYPEPGDDRQTRSPADAAN
jgi:uncharacterized protein (DUF488 family)